MTSALVSDASVGLNDPITADRDRPRPAEDWLGKKRDGRRYVASECPARTWSRFHAPFAGALEVRGSLRTGDERGEKAMSTEDERDDPNISQDPGIPGPKVPEELPPQDEPEVDEVPDLGLPDTDNEGHMTLLRDHEDRGPT